MEILLDKHVPAIGFVISSSIEKGQWALLEKFKKNGFVLGNHTHSHANLGQMTANDYLKDVAKADQRLSSLMVNNHKYFISYDSLTFFIVIAALCGCISIVKKVSNSLSSSFQRLWGFIYSQYGLALA